MNTLARTLAAAALAVTAVLAVAAPASATAAHYTDGSTFDSSTNFGRPPTDPHFAADAECETDVVDPPSFVFVTEHFVYGTTAPTAGVVPVHDDASVVANYVGSAPGLFTIDVSAEVAGRDGFRADTWNIGSGVTAWVPFHCEPPATTTSSSTTTTTVRPTCFLPEGCATTTTTAPVTSTTISSTSTEATTPTTGPPAAATLPFTGGSSTPLGIAGFGLTALGATALAVARRRR